MARVYWICRKPKYILLVLLAIYMVPIFLISVHLRMHDLSLDDRDINNIFPTSLHSGKRNKTVGINANHKADNVSNVVYKYSQNKSNNAVAVENINPKNLDAIPHPAKSRVFNSLLEAEAFMRTAKDIRQSPQIIIEYGNYTKHEPNFITAGDRQLFYASPTMRQKIKGATASEIRGIIDIVPGGTYKHHFECGWMSNISYLKEKRPVTKGKQFDILIPIILDTAYIFQHFYASTIPKLTQIYEYVRRPGVKVLLEKPTKGNEIIFSMLEKFNITGDKIEWHGMRDHSTVYGADYMLFTCNAPPTHPDLWKRIRNYLGVHDELTVPRNQSKIMFMTRKGGTGAHATVRQAVNEADVLQFLRERYGADRVLTFAGSKGLEKDLELYSTVSVMLGVHGGAFYNLNFAPLDMAVIEFVPTLPGGTKDIPHCSTSIFWIMADLLGQTYWRVQSRSMTGSNNVEIDLEKLGKILDHVDARTTSGNKF